MTEELTGRPAPRGPARIPLLHPAELDGERARLHAEILQGPRQAQSSVIPLTDDAGRLMGPFAAMLLAPGTGSAVQAVGAALRGETLLSRRSRELAILAVAARRRSHFEWLAHEPAARAAGVPTAQLQALLDGRVPEGLDPVDEVVVGTTWRLLDDGELDDDGYARATSVLGVEALAALVWLVGYYAMLATALATFRPEGGDPAG